MPVEAHHSMGKVERYHMPLRRVYQILTEELKGQGIPKEVILQMALEVNNDVLGRPLININPTTSSLV